LRLIATTSIEPGMTVARDVHAGFHNQLPLVRSGLRLEEQHRVALRRAGVHAIYVEDEHSDGIDVVPALSEETRALAMSALVRTFAETSARFTESGGIRNSTVLELIDAVQHICDDLAQADHAVLALTDLATTDGYTLQHSLDVTALGLLIARRHFREFGRPAPLGERSYGQIDAQLTKLGVGLLLHDVGKLALPASILKKAGPLDDEEFALVRTHPMRGLELVAGDLIGPLAKAVIRGHHERWGGQGYPDGRSGFEIPEFARIAAVADVFDAITSSRVYSGPSPQHLGVQAIVDGSGIDFDPAIVETFQKVVAPFPPGSEITLADGRRGVVTSVPLGQLDLPTVRVLWDASGERIDRHEVDLRGEPLLAPAVAPIRRVA
jgi:HD-GYP domain-containing protein (c-di-GMP phosphodiesterase class II)